MSELIDRQALLDECLNHYEVGNIEQNCTMDWICKTVRNFPTASPWHRVEEPPKENGKYVAINAKANWWYEASYENGNWKAVDLFCQRWVVIHPTHWMPIEPPKEDEHGN